MGSASVSITEATRNLLQTAGAKFVTSLAGLFASIAWTLAARRRTASLNAAAEGILDRLATFIRFDGGERLLFAQLESAREANQIGRLQASMAKELLTKAETHAEMTERLLQESRDRSEVLKRFEAELLGKTGAQLELSEELLEQAREQTGALKRFETDLAVTLAGAITEAFSPQMEEMTGRLVAAVEGLSEKMGSMNQQALEQMLTNFSGMLKQETSSEMAHLRESLEGLTGRLSGGVTSASMDRMEVRVRRQFGG